MLSFLNTFCINNIEKQYAYKYLRFAYALLEAFVFTDFTVKKDHFGHVGNGIRISNYNMLFGKR